MNPKATFAILLVGSLCMLKAADTQNTSVIYFNREKVQASFDSGTLLLATNNFKIITARRTGPGEVEIHDDDTDIFYVVEGSANFVTGGKAVEAKVTSPGETRAKEIVGGEERRLSKGDVIIIPKRVPHWFKEVHGPLLYYMVKVNKR
jgi:mannose-6-phosphate isomerase-like protein (cupin superfamily)